MKNVLFVITGLGMGGVECVLRDSISLFNNSSNYSVVGVVSLTGRGGAIHSRITEMGFPVFEFANSNSSGASSYFNFVRYKRKLKRLIKELKVDVVHSFMFHSNVLSRFATPKNVVLFNAQRNTDVWRKWYHNLADRWTVKKVSKIVCCSDTVRFDTVKRTKIKPDKFVTVHNGIVTERFVPVRHLFKDVYTVGTVASLTEQKGLDTFVRMVKKLKDDGVSVRARVAGDGPLRDDLESLCRYLDVEVEFCGVVENIPKFLQSLDVFVLTSDWEGFGNVLLEAGATGLPCVATKVGGVPEILSEGSNGFMVPKKDYLKMAECVKRLLSDINLRCNMGRVARNRVLRKFNIENYVNGVVKVWDGVLS